MTVSTLVVPAVYTSTASTNVFSFPFFAYQSSHLLVTIKNPNTWTTFTLQLSPDGTSRDYTVSAITGVGGSVTLINNGQVWMTGGFPTIGFIITIALAPPNTQLTNVRGENRYNPEIHEKEFDLLAMSIQYNTYLISGLQSLVNSNGWLALPVLTADPPTPSSGAVIYFINGGIYAKSSSGTKTLIANTP